MLCNAHELLWCVARRSSAVRNRLWLRPGLDSVAVAISCMCIQLRVCSAVCAFGCRCLQRNLYAHGACRQPDSGSTPKLGTVACCTLFHFHSVAVAPQRHVRSVGCATIARAWQHHDCSPVGKRNRMRWAVVVPAFSQLGPGRGGWARHSCWLGVCAVAPPGVPRRLHRAGRFDQGQVVHAGLPTLRIPWFLE